MIKIIIKTKYSDINTNKIYNKNNWKYFTKIFLTRYKDGGLQDVVNGKICIIILMKYVDISLIELMGIKFI